jgi:fluoroquinolone resistance protein
MYMWIFPSCENCEDTQPEGKRNFAYDVKAQRYRFCVTAKNLILEKEMAMEKADIAGKVFDKLDLAANPLMVGDYEKCTFVSCDFSGAGLANFNFTDCEFTNCNLSLVTSNKTAFRDVRFKHCKILGVHFENCNAFLFSAQFDHCLLNLSSFHKLKLKKTIFRNCSLHEVDFTHADLSGALFENCDLARSLFENTILEKADLRSAYNYSIDPEINKLKKAKFSMEGLRGLLDKYDIEIE